MKTNLSDKEFLKKTKKGYENQQFPFPHVGIKDLLSAKFAEEVFNEIRDFSESYGSQFWQYNSASERAKWTYNKVEDATFPPLTKEALLYFNSKEFVSYLEQITEFTGLMPDNAFTGGGIHVTHGTGAGGILKPHKDFNILPSTLEDDMQWHRVLNLIAYINPKRKPEYKGELILWREDESIDWKKDPTGLLEEISVSPEFNSALLFDTRETVHGQKEPYIGTTDAPRVSLATYYYQLIPKGSVAPHSTVYYMLPGEKETEEERKIRIERASVERYYKNADAYKNEFDRFKNLNL